jgi:hypothetical protein
MSRAFKKCHQLQLTAFKSEKPKHFRVAKMLFKLGNVASFLRREIGRAYLDFNLKNELNF